MKILRNVGVFAGIHVLALGLLIALASPGCSSSRAQTAPSAGPADASAPAPAPEPVPAAPADAGAAAAPQPDASSSSGPVFYPPTRPGTPAAQVIEERPVTGVTPASTYTVVSGDSLTVIARRHHVKVADLVSANHLKHGTPLRIGQKLIIPGAADSGGESGGGKTVAAATEGPQAPEAAPGKVPAEGTRHVVRAGETLGAIARKYGVRVGDIAKANNITDPRKIHPGQELIIPGGKLRTARAEAPSKPAAEPAESAAAPAAEPVPAAAPAAPEAAPDIPVIKVDDSGDQAKP